jgi:succinate dehydrogenase/fumarate reductase flavoprotein subunit
MASQESIDSLISKEALASFDLLNEKVATGVLNFEKLVAKIVEANRNLGGNVGFKKFTEETNNLNEAEKALNKQQEELAKAQAKLQALYTEEAKKIAEVRVQQGLRNQALKDDIQYQMAGVNSLKQAAIAIRVLKKRTRQPGSFHADRN